MDHQQRVQLADMIHAEPSAEAGCHFWFTLPRT